MTKHKRLLFVMALGLALAGQPEGAQTECAAGAGARSRGCLITIAEQYFAALAVHDPSKAPMARPVRFTERPDKRTTSSPVGGNIQTTTFNNTGLPVGEGLWKTMT